MTKSSAIRYSLKQLFKDEVVEKTHRFTKKAPTEDLPSAYKEIWDDECKKKGDSCIACKVMDNRKCSCDTDGKLKDYLDNRFNIK